MDQVLKRRFDAIDAPIDRRSVMTKLPSGKHFVKLSDRRAAPESASTGERTVASRELPPHTLRRTVIPIKFFHAAAVMLAITALGVGQSAAQTGAPSPGGIAATSPLGADFGQTSGDDQSTGAAGVASPAPCTNGPPGGAAPSTFNGGGLSPTSSFTTSGIPAGLGAASGTSAPCNSVSSSGVTSTPNSATTTTPSANSSSSASSASSSLESPTTATVNSSPNTGSLGATALGTNGLGTTGLGTTGLGSLPTQSGSTLQTATSPSTAAQSETSCSGDLSAPPTSSSTGTAQSLSGGVPDPAQSLGGSAIDATQQLSGTASLPRTPVPCPTTTIP